jgi:prophage regulatory protein
MKTQPDINNFNPLLRRPIVEQFTVKGRSTLCRKAQKGLFPNPVKIGGGKSAWLKSEVDSINNARIAGKTDDEIKLLVEKLHLARNAAQ